MGIGQSISSPSFTPLLHDYSIKLVMYPSLPPLIYNLVSNVCCGKCFTYTFRSTPVLKYCPKYYLLVSFFGNEGKISV